MNSTDALIIPVILAVLLLQSSAQIPSPNPDPVKAVLRFSRADGSSYNATTSEVANTTEDLEWQTFFGGASSTDIFACVTGIWRFFAREDYQNNATDTGIILGQSEKLLCYNVGNNRAQFLSKLSYRGLGGDDINWDAIHIYSEPHGGGRQISFYTPFSEYEFELIPLPPDVFLAPKSFLITGAQPASPENTPVYSIISAQNGNPALGSVCFVLNKEINPGVDRIHFQTVMTYDADGQSTPLRMGALQHFTLDVVTEATCPINATIVQNLEIAASIATFPIIWSADT